MLRRLLADRDRGSATVEAIIIVPVLVLVLGLGWTTARVAVAGQSIEAAAGDGARAASISRSPGSAQANGSSAARSTLSSQNAKCAGDSVNVDTSGFAAPVGTDGTVTVTVTCPVQLSDLSFPLAPGHVTITREITSPVDTYRERGGS